MIHASRNWARKVSVNASPAATAAIRSVPAKAVTVVTASVAPNQLSAIERPTSTPKTRPSSWTRAFAVFATPDWRCSLDSSRMPIVSLIPGRNVTSAASVTTLGDASRPRWTIVAAQKLAVTAASGAAIGSVRGVRVAGSAIAPTRSPTTAEAAISRQPPPSTGVSAAPAIAYAASSKGQGRSSGRDLMSASAVSAASGSRRPASTSWTRSSDAGDRVQVDRRRDVRGR